MLFLSAIFPNWFTAFWENSGSQLDLRCVSGADEGRSWDVYNTHTLCPSPVFASHTPQMLPPEGLDGGHEEYF